MRRAKSHHPKRKQASRSNTKPSSIIPSVSRDQTRSPLSRLKSTLFRRYTRFRLPLIPLILASSIILLASSWLRQLPSPKTLEKNVYPISTKILDRHGNLLYEIYDDQNRTPISLQDIPQSVRQATIAIEDKNFYTHHGFDTGGLLRAAWKTLTGQRLEGGSTITQQLVKVALLTPERTLSRKLKEALLTVATEILYTKDQILEMYLNHIPYGGTSYGIEAASHRFFDKPAKDLTLEESALLAGLPQAPSRYSPFADPDAARSRQKQVLSRMVEEAFITQEAALAAGNTELTYASPGIDIRAPHFVMYVRSLLEEQYGVRELEQGGLIVTTTLDLDLQEAAQASLSAEIDSLKRLKVGNGAALITNPGTGEILAMVGSHDYFDEGGDGKVNVTLRPRQPGSSIKPLNYALGLETKLITPSTMLLDTPICFSVEGQADYCPKNYDNTFRGLTQIRFALGNSLNIPAVKVLALNGIGNFISFGNRLGIASWDNPDNYGLSLTLGGGELKMTELATAFGVFANSGTKVPLQAILEIKDNSGQVLASYSPTTTREQVELNRDLSPTPDNGKVLSAGTSFLISHILSDNNAREQAFGTGSVLNIPGRTVSVKTGTTNNLRDNWTIGYTRDRLVAVWVGNNDNTPMSYVASGITGASPIWADLMRYSLAGLEKTDLYRPDDEIEGASVCSDTGILPAGDNPCPTRYEYFLKGVLPPATNPIERRRIFVNRDTHHPPAKEEEFGNVEEQEHSLISDLFVKDYCLDCAPYPEGYSQAPTLFPYTTLGKIADHEE